ncbi:MAG TPA: glycosyltransferase, partial [Amphiplicatus sp.]|nr:glycosyltransferase [Amphiplicatus sp.]
SADVFFNPSITETFGNVTLEAMSSGLPSICASASGSLSLVEEGRTGLLSSPEAGAQGYAEKILELAGDSAARSEYGAAARARAGEFSWPVILDGLIANYRAAISDNKI